MKINKDSKILKPLKYVKYIYMRGIAKNKMKKMKDIDIETDFYKIIEDIEKNRKSVARFGDSELRVMIGVNPGDYQKPNEKISLKLKEILKCDNENLCVGITAFLKGYDKYVYDARYYFSWFICKYFDKIYPNLNKNKKYINTSFTRIYLRQKDKSDVPNKFTAIKKLWNNRDIVFIEGEFSRLGVGNDLFDNAKSIKRILCPAKQAFDVYDEIFNEAKKLDKEALIILALGSTATALAYDLSKEGYQALDLGHIDIEYEWFRMGATEPVAIPGKYTNETPGNEKVKGNIENREYENSIIARIGV